MLVIAVIAGYRSRLVILHFMEATHAPAHCRFLYETRNFVVVAIIVIGKLRAGCAVNQAASRTTRRSRRLAPAVLDRSLQINTRRSIRLTGLDPKIDIGILTQPDFLVWASCRPPQIGRNPLRLCGKSHTLNIPGHPDIPPSPGFFQLSGAQDPGQTR